MIGQTKIVAVAAMTLDGKIAAENGRSTDWTSPEDKDFLHDFLDKSEVVLVGRKTYELAAAQLAKRKCIVFSRTGDLKRRSENLLIADLADTDLKKLLAPYRTATLLGGAQIYTYFLERGLVDELYLTLEPVVFGRGLALFASQSSLRTDFKLTSIRQLNEKGSILLHYRI